MINYAYYAGVCISERDHCTPVPEFQREVRAALAELSYEGPIAWVDNVHSVEWVEPGDVLIECADGELIEAFRARARARGFGLGKSIVFGGLRPMPTDDSSSQVQTEHS